MKKYWLNAYANIRKSKSASVTLMIMFILSAFLLNTGLLIVTNYGNFFKELKAELNASDAYIFMSDAVYNDDVEELIKNNQYVEETETHEIIILQSKIFSQGSKRDFSISLNNMDETQMMSKWKYIDYYLPAEDMSVYIPDVFQAVSGYQLNDKIKLEYKDFGTGDDKTLTFTVKGYTEDIFFSSTDTGIMSFYLPNETYEKVESILDNPLYRGQIIFTKLDKISNASKMEGDLRKELGIESATLMGNNFMVIDVDLIEMSRCMMASMISMMLVVFAMIIVVVCLLAVRFRIVNSIEDDMVKFGSLKAVGYTSRQIVAFILLQFGAIASVGSLIGIALSYPMIPVISKIFEQQSGLKWVQGFDLDVSAMAFGILVVIVLAVSWLTARKIRKLTPVNALRGEHAANKNKKNRMPLEKANGNLSIVLAFKYVRQNLKQSIMVLIIVAAVTFVGVFGMIMFYNTAIDTKAFEEIPGMEIGNAVATFNQEKDQKEALEEIKAMEGVRKAQYIDEVKVGIEEADVTATLMKDYDAKESNFIYEGRYPNSSKEIALAGILAERLEKKIGDKVDVGVDDKKEVFEVVGLTSGASMGGENVSMLEADYKDFKSDFNNQTLYIYLESDVDVDAFVKKLDKQFDDDLLVNAMNFDKLIAEGMASYQNIVLLMGIVMFAITLSVIALVIYFIIGSSIVRRKKELGIQKAIGYTTFQLMNQISTGFAVPIIVGGVIGCIAGALYTNPIMSVTMKGMGIMKANFIIIYSWVAILGIATILFAYILSLLVTWRIRKISAYALVTE